MAINPSNMELTPAIISWQPAGATAFTDLGGSLGNIKVALSTEKAEIKADQTGTTPLDKRVSGHKYTVTTEIAEVNDFTLAGYLFPNATTITSGASAALQWNNAVGNSDISVAGQLKLHPQNRDTADESHDWLFYKAVPTEISEISYGPTDQSRFKVEWTIYPDTSNPYSASGTDYRFMRYGDKDF